MKRLLVTIISVSCVTAAIAQVPERPAFHSINTIQLMTGSTTTSFALNSVNGFEFNRNFVGLGTGFDYYYQTTVPLFVELRYTLLKSKNTLQAFGQAGVHFPLSSNKDESGGASTYEKGNLWGAGLDYIFPMDGGSLSLGAGFSYKQFIQIQENNVWDPVLQRIENMPIKKEYSTNRIACRVGWIF
jgi:hypothetical protein